MVPSCWIADEATSMLLLSSMRWRPWNRLEYKARGSMISVVTLRNRSIVVAVPGSIVFRFTHRSTSTGAARKTPM